MQYYSTPPWFGNKKSRRRLGQRFLSLKNILLFIFLGMLFSIFVFFVMMVWFSIDLPTPGKLSNSELKSSTKILDKEDVLLYSMYKDYNRIYVKLDSIPDDLKNATIVAEDAEFYQNKGFSLRGYLRAARDIVFKRKLTGGSTLTQQLVKNVLLTPERSISRKIKELILSIEVESRYSKDEILEMYLNDVPYGGTAVGIEAASNLYFGKHVGELNLSESAFLAGLPQAPSYYSPYINSDKAYIERTEYVLRRLEEEGYISSKQKEAALEEAENFKFTKRDTSIKAPHFVMYVRAQLVEMFGEAMVEKGNLEVKTTLDYDIQEKAEGIVKEELDKLKGYNVGNGASVALDVKTGGILAMVGSKDYFNTENDGNFNAATGIRQPGSSLKPIMYAAAFEKGYTPSNVIMDTRTDFYSGNPADKVYSPENYDSKYRGPVQLRFALGNSLNVPAVKMLSRIGIKPVMQKAYDMGIENWQPTSANIRNVGLSLVLGGREATLLQITSAYSVFANEGVKKSIFSISEVKDEKGNVIYKHTDRSGQRVLSEEIAFLISHILLDNNARADAFGERSWLVVPGKTVAAKTGTTDMKRDNWTIGYTPSFVVGVWVGNNDNSEMNPKIASGITGATPIWNKIMQQLLKDKPDEQFVKPDKVMAMEIDAFSGGLPVGDHSKRTEYFIKGTEPTTTSPIYKKLKISKYQGNKLANRDEIEHGDYDLKEYVVFEEMDPVSQDGKNRWQEAIDKWLRETYSADHSEYYPPTEVSDYKYEEKKKEEKTPTVTPTPQESVTPTFTPTPTLTLTPTP